MGLSKDIRHVKDILHEILEIDNGLHFSTIQQMIKGIASKTQASLKSELIGLIATSNTQILKERQSKDQNNPVCIVPTSAWKIIFCSIKSTLSMR